MENFELYEPLGNWMILVPKQVSEVSTGGIVIPEQARFNLTQGTIMKMGKDVKEFGLGDEVVFTQHTDTKIEVDDRVYILVEDRNIVLVKRVPGNKLNHVNQLMTTTGHSFQRCSEVYLEAEGDYDKALATLQSQ